MADNYPGADLVGGVVVSAPNDFFAAVAAEARAGDEAGATRRTDDDDRLAELLSAVFIVLCRAGWCSELVGVDGCDSVVPVS